MDSQQEHMDTSDLYASLPLGTFEIRVLLLEPAACPTARIDCKLECRSLDPVQSRNLESLSYTWGSRVGTEEIWVNDLRRLVTSNLAAFLRHRRDATDTVSLWIDAICINQADPEEKERQIPMMNMIYSTSPQLNIWLGPEQDDSDIAMDQLWALGSCSPYDKMPILTGRTLKALEQLLNRPWWSRVWILQEVLFGAMGAKLNNARVRCGKMNIQWVHVVIAAVRMQSHRDDMRQYFPAIDNILFLENLRDQALNRITAAAGAATKDDVLELVSRFRRLQSTDPRDKIFALLGMLFKDNQRPFTDIRPNYTATVEEAFTSFALYMLDGGSKLTILRHCHVHLIEGLPSWVPDWSFSSSALPLPSKRSDFRPNIPWWIESFKDPDDKRSTTQLRAPDLLRNEQERDGEERRRLADLRLASGGIRVVGSDDRLPKTIEGLPPELQSLARQLIASESLVVFDASQELYGGRAEQAGYKDVRSDDSLAKALENITSKSSTVFDTSKDLQMEQSRQDGDKDTLKDVSQEEREAQMVSATITKGERITQRRTNLSILDALSPAPHLFTAAAQTEPLVRVEIDSRTLSAEGFLWDTIDEIHDPFPDNVDADWQDATRFMVSVGICKAIALKNSAATDLYSSAEGQCEAFWLTMFAGQTELRGHFGEIEDMRPTMRFEHWLPELPQHWLPTEPRVTVATNGRLHVADYIRRCKTAMTEYLQSTVGSNEQLLFDMPGVGMDQNLLPSEWNKEDIELHRSQFNHLASLWRKQPYDLYHLPFSLLNTIPDPYWEIRAHDDSLALLKNREYGKRTGFFHAVSDAPFSGQDIQEIMDEEANNSVGAVPSGTLRPGMEKYALGRRFFITKRGYFGLAPKEAKSGDRITVLLGLDVPLICRNNRDSTYKIVGKSYVHGLMDGELIKKWENEQTEICTVTLK
ncbi:HET-domain-containing protein [Rhizodiscina lignyota]|uniref:HET-domain-containing protein n=1 Tax=Rhizodiscina lignyota TaxID=1504668 RepID=A0A9P4M6L1_9PEZI|nr:HET-domain-containing protein [Rhizodiscina lignyota]